MRSDGKGALLGSPTFDFVEPIEMNLIRKSLLLGLRRDPENTESLMQSIRQVGLLQPILVRRTDDGFEIVAGNRRYEACRRLRWRKIPSCIAELSDKDAFEVALTENIQRKSLNPIQEAEAFTRYVKEYGWGGVSELGKRIGKSQEYVSQRILLLTLPDAVRQKIVSRQLNPSAARELIWVKDSEQQERMADYVVKNKIPTRAVRYLAKAARGVGLHEIQDRGRGPEPEFEQYAHLREVHNPAFKALEKVILALRISMFRIDSVVSELEGGPRFVRELLMEERRALHSLIDNAVKAKVSLKEKMHVQDISK